ncbi:MAG: acyltransferase, partial [Alloacidobacterium sp.]
MPKAQAVYPGKLGYIPTLDGWRAVAILLVMLHHDRLHHFLGTAGIWLQKYGSRGVDLFFALSGLLICTRLLEEEQLTGTIRLKNFYLRRLFRIQPAVLVYLATICLLMLAGALQHAWGGILFGLLLVRNYFPLHLVTRDYYTGHIWSLSVEEHFYLFLPFFLRRVRNHRATILLSCVVLLSLWRHFVFTHSSLQ